MSNTGVISMGVRCPIIRQGDDLADIVIENVKKTLEENHMSLEDKDVIGITESVVARAQGNYVTVDDIVESIREEDIEATNGSKIIVLVEPIMSRNRFAMILKAFARYSDKIYMVHSANIDQQGNPTWEPNPFTGVDIEEYYKEICKSENCEFYHRQSEYKVLKDDIKDDEDAFVVYAQCHPDEDLPTTLASFITRPIVRADGTQSGYNEDWGLLGCNKADEETLKLFPQKDKAQSLVNEIQERIFNETGKKLEVMVYGDGCFKDPVGGIWEWADPVVSPAYTSGLEGTPNEIKIKAFADDKYKKLSGDELTNAVKNEIIHKDDVLIGKMASQGTTPRRYVDLLGSCMDLTSGSGDKGTPVVIIKNYFNNYSNQ